MAHLHQVLAHTIVWERENPPPDDPAQFDYAAEDAFLAGRHQACP